MSYELYQLHTYSQNLNWDDLAQKKVPAPFVPRISDELDVSNFSEEFTAMVPQDSPAIVPPDIDKIFNVSVEKNLWYTFFLPKKFCNL